MLRILRAISPIATLTLVLGLAVAAPAGGPASAQNSPLIGVDADPTGNEAANLGDVDRCVSVHSGDTFAVDIFIRDVDELLAWEVYIEFDPEVVEVVGRDVDMFLGANSGSSVFDASSGVPDNSGLYRMAAADTSDPPTPDSGSGVLVRTDLKALKRGVSDILLATRDINGDGTMDAGPLLRNVDAEVLGDENGDAIFDGPIENAQVGVDTACTDVPPSGNSSPGDDEEGVSPLLIAVAAAGSGAALVAGLLGLRFIRRRRAPSG